MGRIVELLYVPLQKGASLEQLATDSTLMSGLFGSGSLASFLAWTDAWWIGLVVNS